MDEDQGIGQVHGRVLEYRDGSQWLLVDDDRRVQRAFVQSLARRLGASLELIEVAVDLAMIDEVVQSPEDDVPEEA